MNHRERNYGTCKRCKQKREHREVPVRERFVRIVRQCATCGRRETLEVRNR